MLKKKLQKEGTFRILKLKSHFEKPSEIFAKLFALMPDEIPIARKIYPEIKFIGYFKINLEFKIAFSSKFLV